MQMTNLKDFSPCVVSHENRSGKRPWGKTRDTEESQEIRASVFVGSPPPLGGWWMVLATTEQVVIRGTWTISLDNKSFSAEIFVGVFFCVHEYRNINEIPRFGYRTEYTGTGTKNDTQVH